MKKKLLFCLQTMVMGGVEKELITILKRFYQTVYEIDLILFYISDPEITRQVPDGINVRVLDINKDYWLGNLSKMTRARLKNGRIFEALSLTVKTLISGGASSSHISITGLEAPDTKYDVAICYHMHSGIVLRYVAEIIQAKRKIAWIHNDFSMTGFRVRSYMKDLKEYDSFVAVSERLKTEFVARCPEFESKTITLHNIVDEEEIRRKAEEKTDDYFENDNRIKLVTVGRYVEQKGYDLAISACRILLDRGYNIAWYAIGWGPEEEKMQLQVKVENVQNSFFILGRKDNPYSYIDKADVYVQPSRHEGYAVTICEAIVLGKKIVTTDFAGAREQIQDGITGYIADELTAESVSNRIIHALSSEPLCKNSTNEQDWKKIEETIGNMR